MIKIFAALITLILLTVMIILLLQKNRIKKAAKGEIERRDKLLLAVNHAANVLLALENDESAKSFNNEDMETICSCLNVDRFEFWQNEMKNGELHTVLKHSWLSELGRRTIPDTFIYDFPYSTIPQWECRLSRGEKVIGPVSGFSQEDRDFFGALNVKSAFVIPVFIKNQFWGFCSIEDCSRERDFKADEANILLSICYMMVNAINRRILNEEIRETHNRAKILLDSTPLSCQLFDSSLKKIDCNQEAVNLFGFKSKQEFLERYYELYPEYQPDGQKSIDKAQVYLKKALKEGICSFDWTYRMLDGSIMPAQGIVVRVAHGDDFLLAGYVRDLREQNRMMKAIQYRDKLLFAANRSTAFLLNSDKASFEYNLFQAMEVMGKAAGVDRMYIWKNSIVDCDLCCTQVYEWSEGADPQQGNEFTVNISYRKVVPYWGEMLAQNKCVNSYVRNLPKGEREHLEAQGVLSILAVPIFIKDEFWGFAGFDDCHNERQFTDEEETILRSSSLLFANAWLRFEMEREVTRVNEFTKLMLDSAPLCCQIWDRNLNTIDCNEAGVKLYGFGSKQEYAERFASDCSPEYQSDGQRSGEKAKALVNKAFEEGYCVFDWMHKMPDEDTLIPAKITLVRVEYGNDYVVLGYTYDLREHNRMMKEIEYKDYLLQVVNSSAFLLLNSDTENFNGTLSQTAMMIAKAVNVDAVFIWKNYEENQQLHCTKLFGWPENSGRYAVGASLCYNKTIPGWEEILSKGECINSIVRDMPAEIQFPLSHTLSILVVPVFSKGVFWGFTGFNDNQRERLFTETEVSVLRSGSLLAAHAFMRNEMLVSIFETSEQLKSALKEANIASRAKGDFLSNMSHEMRTPMNAIIGMTAIGMRGTDLEEKNQALKKIGDASSHLLGVINDILDMAKIEANKLELVPVEFNFEKLIQRVLAVANYRVEEKQQTLTVNLDKNIPDYIVGDDQLLAQVITNLLSNAAKFTPEGGFILLEAHLTGEKDGNCELRIFVADSGIGISRENQKKLFKSFQQAESGMSREYGGSGLGLAISKHIVELMGGKIWVESEPGKGAKFIFTIKAQRTEKKQTSISAHDEISDQITGLDSADGEFAGKRLLLADDIEINREVTMALLENTGIIIDCAENGEEVLNMINGAPDKYDIVFMDIQMPKMDGYEAARRIRALPSMLSAKLPIIAMTANVFKSDIEACLAAGMDGHLGKPLDIEKVLEILRKYLRIQ